MQPHEQGELGVGRTVVGAIYKDKYLSINLSIHLFIYISFYLCVILIIFSLFSYRNCIYKSDCVEDRMGKNYGALRIIAG